MKGREIMDFEYKPTLTLSPDGAAAPKPEEMISSAEKKVEAPAFTMENLTDAERKMVGDFAKTIDIEDATTVLEYGAGAQKNISEFSGAALKTVRTKDMGEVGGMLTGLVVELKSMNFEPEDKKGIKGIFRKASTRIEELKAQYDKAEVNVNKIVEELEKHQVTLLKDVAMLDKMYELNQAYFKELSMYILAGKQRLAECRATKLKELQEKAEPRGILHFNTHNGVTQNCIIRHLLSGILACTGTEHGGYCHQKGYFLHIFINNSFHPAKLRKLFCTFASKYEKYANKHRPDSMVRPHLGSFYFLYPPALLATA